MRAAFQTLLLAAFIAAAMADWHHSAAASMRPANLSNANGSLVSFPGPEVTLNAILYRPGGAGPFPAVVALHGCGGLSKSTAARDRAWAQRLTSGGFVVLFPDSFGSRHLGPQCRVHRRRVTGSRERVADARAALRWLQAQPFIKPDRVSLLGWSNGANAVLWTVRRTTKAEPRLPDFRTAAALYPGCRRSNATAWSARIPTLVLIGANDDWTPAAACEQMIAGARGRSAQVAIIVYRGAYHGFDYPNRPVKAVKGVAQSADGSGTVHMGTNAAARDDAYKRVLAWLAR